MAMLLSANQLQQIVVDLEKLQDAGLHVTEMMSAGHIIKLKMTDDQREGRMYQVTGIYTPDSLPSKVLRS
jgi:hypothetical protein